ncbi:MAG: chemotaxis protein CheA, partial [Bdellovibrionales bacterium]|nr:chemotaxis protein CheA [Bdellovibrionales bacterium]
VDEFEALFQAAKEEYAQSQQSTATVAPETTKAVCEPELTTGPVMDQRMEEEESCPPQEAAAQPIIDQKPTPSVKEEKRVSVPQGENDKKQSLSDTSLRVDVNLLDSLMNLVGELVLARNQILQFTKTQTDTAFVSTTHQLNLITSELQEGVMRTRMQPISNVWSKFPRVVRDISHNCGKKVRIEMEGKETELDKTILEAIKDPLTHIIRNSVDHGIEDPETRAANGKDPEGCLMLRAFHEGGHVIIEISDDGAGVNSEKVKSKVIEKGILSPEQVARMNEQELANLIFLPGLSTAAQVTNISGRGVGMDVVRSNIEKIGGSVDLHSEFGKRTTLKVKIPLTLAIIPALLVSVHNQTFAIPQVSLVELLRVEGEQLESAIQKVQGVHFYRLRGNLLPLIYLNEELKTRKAMVVETPSEDIESESEMKELDQRKSEVMSIVVIKVDEKQFGVVVDQVYDTEEIVVKPLGKQLNSIDVFAGATILGDGSIALIVDVSGLARSAGISSETAEVVALEEKTETSTRGETRQTLLLVQVGDKYTMAVPLEQVHRLEEFENESIELASGRELVQYRGGILPLLSLSKFFKQESSQTQDVRFVVVYSENGKSIGLVVDKILDIVEEEVVINHRQGGKGIAGSAIIQNKIT